MPALRLGVPFAVPVSPGVPHSAEGNEISFVSGFSAQNLTSVDVRGMIAPATLAPHGKGLLLDFPVPRHICHFLFPTFLTL